MSCKQMKSCKSASLSIAAGSSREYQPVFQYLDKDGDGKISPTELRMYMTGAGEDLSHDEIEVMFSSVDMDGDGLLDFDEFMELMDTEGSEEERNGDLKEAFRMYEMEGRGYVTHHSLKKTLSRLGDSRSIAECQAMIRRFDLNGDGVLSFEEFQTMMV